MTCVKVLLVGLIAAASIAAADDLSPSRAPGRNGLGTRSEIAEPISVMSLVPVTDSPPPFGTVMQSWQLNLSGSYAGAGITWRRDSARFYLADQGYSGASGLWSCTAEDPRGTTRRENCVMPNLGSSTTDIPWGIAWDNDSSCFWITNILDGSVYSGCYLVKLTLGAGDTWRLAEPVQAQDTWRIDGAMSCYWLAGMEKWADHGCFYACPVASSGSLNRIVKFDPYTKTFIGRLPNGPPEPSANRGCALVPWDSCYILTCGWNSNNGLLKLDSTGAVIDSGLGGSYGPADIALYVPQTIEPDDTVCLYDICSDPNNTMEKVSVGMLWSQLPSVNPRALSLTIVAPVGTIDSGESVIPTVAIRNLSNEPAYDVSVYFSIPEVGWCDSITHFNIDMRTTETLAFYGPARLRRDSLTAVAWENWSCDTVRSRFFVRVKDVAMPWLQADKDTYDVGEPVHATARIENRGNVSVNCDVRIHVGNYLWTRNLNLIVGGWTEIGCDPGPMPPGIYIIDGVTLIADDLVPENNWACDTIVVRGPIDHDYAVLEILEPTGIKDTMTPVAPSALIKNQGTQPDEATVFFRIVGPDDSVVMFDSSYCILSPGDSTPATFPETRFTRFGRYTSACSVYVDGEQNNLNDKKIDTFEVAPVGVADGSFIVPRLSFSVTPNPATSGFVVLSFTGPLDHLTTGPLSLSLFNISGRLVLHSSLATRNSSLRLDLRSMPAGVYVLRASAGTFTCSEKLVVQR